MDSLSPLPLLPQGLAMVHLRGAYFGEAVGASGLDAFASLADLAKPFLTWRESSSRAACFTARRCSAAREVTMGKPVSVELSSEEWAYLLVALRQFYRNQGRAAARQFGLEIDNKIGIALRNALHGGQRLSQNGEPRRCPKAR